MSSAAIGLVGLLIGTIIVGGVILWILRSDDNSGAGPTIVELPTDATTSLPPEVTSPGGTPVPDLVDRRPPAGEPTSCEPDGPCLRISASGPGSVSYFLSDRVTELTCPPACEATFNDGVLVSIFRTRGLSDQEENAARLSEWGADCSHLAADDEPRGGVCDLTMDGDRSVSVSFVDRPRLAIQMPGSTTGFFNLEYTPEQVYAAAPRGDRLTCGEPPCTVEYFYDRGTEVTIYAGYRTVLAQTAAVLEWGGDCAGTPGWDRQDPASTDPGVPCSVTLNGDTAISLTFRPFTS